MRVLRSVIQVMVPALLVFILQGCNTGPMVLTQAMHDSIIDVESGRVVDVELAENPSTGWTWKLQAPLNGILEPNGVSFTPGQGAGGRVGVGGLRVFHYRAASVGEASLVYALVPPGAGGKASDQTFTVTVRVSK